MNKKTEVVYVKPMTCEEYVLQELQKEKDKVVTLGEALERERVENKATLEQAKITLDDCCDSYEAQIKERDARIEELEKIVNLMKSATYAKVEKGYMSYISFYKTENNAIAYELFEKLALDNPNCKVEGEENA